MQQSTDCGAPVAEIHADCGACRGGRFAVVVANRSPIVVHWLQNRHRLWCVGCRLCRIDCHTIFDCGVYLDGFLVVVTAKRSSIASIDAPESYILFVLVVLLLWRNHAQFFFGLAHRAEIAFSCVMRNALGELIVRRVGVWH